MYFTIREYSPFLILQKLLSKVPGQPVQTAKLFVMEAPVASIDEFIIDARIREATPGDIAFMSLLENKNKIFKRRFVAGDRCFVAIIRDQIVGYEWFTNHPVHVEERFCYPLNIPDDAIYAYDALIKSENRRQGIWSSLQRYIICEARREGRKKVMAMIDHDNQISIQAHLRFGYVFSKQVLVFMIFGKTFFWEKWPLPDKN